MIPTKNPIRKSVILSAIVLAIIAIVIGVLSSVLDSSFVLRYFFIGTIFNAIRFLTLGAVVGYQYKRLQVSAK
jgi:putative Mn2+ efflux pump MntP